MKLGELEIEESATEAAGNWRDFDCFVWFRSKELADAEQWSVIYTHHRDSRLLDQSNAAVIRKALLPFTDGDDPDAVAESHSHWAVGHIDGFSVRVFKNGEVTQAFQTYHRLAEQMADYPVLDESDYSERELEATLENIGEAAWRLKRQFELPGGWEGDVYSWLSEHRYSAIENSDDQGGWPDEDDLTAAFAALAYESVE